MIIVSERGINRERNVYLVNKNYAAGNIAVNDNDEEDMDLNIKFISPIKKSTAKVYLNQLFELCKFS